MANRFDINGIRYVDTCYHEEEIEKLINHRKEYVKGILPYSPEFNGKGIVICAGGVSYFTCAWVLINTLRKNIKCTLPIQLWYIGDEMDQAVIDLLEPFDVTCHNILDYSNETISSGYQLKPLAILYSSFKEVLYLDADNICVRDPEFLFEHPFYKKYGTMFWPDFWQTDKNNPIWRITEVEPVETQEQESGQILINKELCWKELNLALYYNLLGRVYYRLLLGDKDTFKFAWMTLHTKFYFIEYALSSCGYINEKGLFSGNTMVQHAPDGTVCFLHRNFLKWDITKPDEKVWHVIKSFKKNARDKEYANSLSNEKLYQMDFKGDTEEVLFDSVAGGLEDDCLKYLSELRAMDIYKGFFICSYITSRRRIY